MTCFYPRPEGRPSTGTVLATEKPSSAKTFEMPFPGLIMLRTKRGLGILDAIGRSWPIRPLGWIVFYTLPIFGAAAVLLILLNLYAYLSSPLVREFGRVITPFAALLIPGLNPFLPLLYGWIGLVVTLLVHEGAHGVQARALGLPVKSGGLLLFLGLPIGAFVEVDEDQMKKTRLRDAGRVLAAGPGSNMVVGVGCLALLLLVVSTMSPVVPGIGVRSVAQGFPAGESGLIPGDVLTHVNGARTETLASFYAALGQLAAGDTARVGVYRDGRSVDRQVLIPVGIVVIGVVSGYPAEAAGINPGDTITTIGGVTVGSPEDLASALENRRPGQNVTLTVGRDLDSHVISLTLASHPQNQSAAFLGIIRAGDQVQAIGIQPWGLQETLTDYLNPGFPGALLYLTFPTLGEAQLRIPYSDTLQTYYTSSIGPYFYPVAHLLFWLWFINFNVGIFNALPIYPLDGGQFFRRGLQAAFRGRLTDEGVKRISIAVSILFLAVILSNFLLPYLDSVLSLFG